MSSLQSIEEIRKKLIRNKKKIKEKYKIKEIGIFGSYVRGEQKKNSDLDILVEFEKDTKIGLLRFLNIENHIGNLLGIKVDLVEKSVLKPRIGEYILKEVIYL